MSKINLSETVPNINCMPLLALMNPKIRLISYTSPLKKFYLQKTLLNVFPKHMNVQFPVQKCDFPWAQCLFQAMPTSLNVLTK